MSTDLGFRTDFFGDRKCLLEKIVQKYAQAMVFLSSFHGLFHLADDLGFAQHIESRPEATLKAWRAASSFKKT